MLGMRSRGRSGPRHSGSSNESSPAKHSIIYSTITYRSKCVLGSSRLLVPLSPGELPTWHYRRFVVRIPMVSSRSRKASAQGHVQLVVVDPLCTALVLYMSTLNAKKLPRTSAVHKRVHPATRYHRSIANMVETFAQYTPARKPTDRSSNSRLIARQVYKP